MTRPLWLASLALVAAAGCATDDTPTASGGGPVGRTIKADPSYAADIQEIFDRRGCSDNSCHGTIAQGALDLRAGNSYAELVNVQSAHPASPLVLVRPGFAEDSSYLVDKLDGTGFGQRMPQGALPLDSIDMQNIINWINQGAKNN